MIAAATEGEPCHKTWCCQTTVNMAPGDLTDTSDMCQILLLVFFSKLWQRGMSFVDSLRKIAVHPSYLNKISSCLFLCTARLCLVGRAHSPTLTPVTTWLLKLPLTVLTVFHWCFLTTVCLSLLLLEASFTQSSSKCQELRSQFTLQSATRIFSVWKWL